MEKRRESNPLTALIGSPLMKATNSLRETALPVAAWLDGLAPVLLGFVDLASADVHFWTRAAEFISEGVEVSACSCPRLCNEYGRIRYMKIGYARVSTREQHPESQEDALRDAGCERVFIDKISGKLAKRPEMDKAIMMLRSGDQLVVTKLDRLGRSLKHLIELSAWLDEQGVGLVVLNQGIDTSTAIGRMFFHILGAIAEFEHELLSERTMDGLAAARARGRTGGQKPKLKPRQMKLAREMYDEVGPDGKRLHTVAGIAAELGVSRPTVYRALEATS